MSGVLAETVVYLYPVEADGNDGANLFHSLSVDVRHAQLVEGVNCHSQVGRIVIEAKYPRTIVRRTQLGSDNRARAAMEVMTEQAMKPGTRSL